MKTLYCSCQCVECLESSKDDELRMAMARLDTYRALASEAYISLSSSDPILTAFVMAKRLTRVAKRETHYLVSIPQFNFLARSSNLRDNTCFTL